MARNRHLKGTRGRSQQIIDLMTAGHVIQAHSQPQDLAENMVQLKEERQPSEEFSCPISNRTQALEIVISNVLRNYFMMFLERSK